MTDWKNWLYGLIAAIIGGVSNSILLIVADPLTFNFNDGLKRLITVAASTAIISAAMYLKQSPLPKIGTKVVGLLLLISILSMSACATTGALTPDEKARQAISAAQGQWEIWFDTAKTYYASRPDKKAEYKDKVLPAFQFALSSIRNASAVLQAGGSADAVQNQIKVVINDLMLLLTQLEVIR